MSVCNEGNSRPNPANLIAKLALGADMCHNGMHAPECTFFPLEKWQQ